MANTFLVSSVSVICISVCYKGSVWIIQYTLQHQLLSTIPLQRRMCENYTQFKAKTGLVDNQVLWLASWIQNSWAICCALRMCGAEWSVCVKLETCL